MDSDEFKELCYSTFGKILSSFGFLAAVADPFQVRYVLKNVYVEIIYDEREGEIFVYLGRMHNGNYYFNPNSEFTLNELLQEMAPEKVYRRMIFRETKDIEIELHRLSWLLEEEGKNILNGKVEVFSKLLERRIKERKKQERFEYVSDIKTKAEIAFKQSDYKVAISLYKTIESELTSVERKRYEIALREDKGSGLNN